MKILTSAMAVSFYLLVSGCSTSSYDSHTNAYSSQEPSNSYYHPSEKIKKPAGSPADRNVSSTGH